MKLIKREEYLKKLIDVMGTPDIKVITGIRRSGKSKLLESFRDYLRETVPNANIIHINFNFPEYDGLLTYHALYDDISKRRKAGVPNYVLIDEVQMCENCFPCLNL